MRSNVKLQQELWVEAVLTTCYLVNRSPSTTTRCKIPKEVWRGQHCYYSNVKIFGWDTYSIIPKNQCSNLLDMVIELMDIDCGILLPTKSSLIEIYI